VPLAKLSVWGAELWVLFSLLSKDLAIFGKKAAVIELLISNKLTIRTRRFFE
jgi:hypothetical protein